MRIAQELHDDAQQIFGTVLREYLNRISPPHRDTFLDEMGAGQKAIDAAINELIDS